MKFVRKIKRKILSLIGFECFHEEVKNDSCKFCPDCGKKVQTKWVSIKCSQCGYFRKPAVNFFYKILPVKKFCCFCGSDKWRYQYYYENIPDKLKLISVLKVETIGLQTYKFGDMTKNIDIWVESPYQKNQGTNFAKFK